MAKTKDWRVQWYVAADGTVIQQRSKGDEAHQQLYQRYATHRPVTVSELDAMRERHASDASRDTVVLLVGTGVPLAGFVAGLVCLVLGIDDVGRWLLYGCGGLLLLLRLGLLAFHRRGITRWDQTQSDAGLVPGNGVTLGSGEARALIDAPGTVAGRVFEVERA